MKGMHKMNISSVQNNSQSFGMSLSLIKRGPENLAAKFHNSRVPEFREDKFTHEVINAVKDLKSKLIYDGSKVFVKPANHLDGDVVEITLSNKAKASASDKGRFGLLSNNARWENNHYQSMDEEDMELLGKFKKARDLAVFYDKKEAERVASRNQFLSQYTNGRPQESVEETANRLQNLYG